MLNALIRWYTKAFVIVLQCAIPLGMCSVAPAQEQGQPFAFTISGEEVEVCSSIRNS